MLNAEFIISSFFDDSYTGNKNNDAFIRFLE